MEPYPLNKKPSNQYSRHAVRPLSDLLTDEHFPKWRLVMFIFFPYAFQLCASLHHSSPASAAAPSSPAGVGSFQMTSGNNEDGKKSLHYGCSNRIPMIVYIYIFLVALARCVGCVGWGLQCDVPNYLSYSYMWHIYIYTILNVHIFHTYMIYEYKVTHDIQSKNCSGSGISFY